MSMLGQYLVTAIVLAATNAMIGAAFSIVLGVTRVFHLAFAGVFTVSAYVFYFLYTLQGWHAVPAGAVTVVVAAFLGLACEAWLYERLRRRGTSHFVLFLASLGLTIILQNFVAAYFGSDNKNVVLSVSPNYVLWGASFSLYEAATVVMALVLLPVLLLFLHSTKTGQAMMALSENLDGARVVGINVPRMRQVAAALGAALSAIPAVLIALSTSVYPLMGFAVVFIGVSSAIVGGIGQFAGAIVAGVIIGLTQGLGAWAIGNEWQTAIIFVILFLVLFFKPTGLFGGRLWRAEV